MPRQKSFKMNVHGLCKILSKIINYYKKRSKKLSTYNRIRRKIKNPTSVFKIWSKIITCCMPTKKCKIFQPTCQNYAKKFKIQRRAPKYRKKLHPKWHMSEASCTFWWATKDFYRVFVLGAYSPWVRQICESSAVESLQNWRPPAPII